MNEDFVPYELAVKLKEKGFPQRPDYFNYSSYYEWDGLRKTHSLSNASVWFDTNISRDNIYSAPTISQVLKWLRESKEIYVSITPQYNEYSRVKGVEYRLEVHYWKDDKSGYIMVEWLDEEDPHIVQCFESYELAAIAGIEYCLDNLI